MRYDSDMNTDPLHLLRQQIDAADNDLLALLSKRASLAAAVGQLKEKTSAPMLRPEREAQIIERMCIANSGPLPTSAITGVWREIISSCRALEARLKIAFLGPIGTFSEQALFAHFGSQVDAIACSSIDEVFRATQANACDFGVVPVENSSEGAVNRTLDLFLQTPLQICAEISIPVRHHLMAKQIDMKGVTSIRAHSQALAQCIQWLNQHYPDIERVAVSSNAEAARQASQDVTIAGIASDVAAKNFDLQMVADNIQDDPANRTRFAVIGNHRCGPSGQDQTSLILSVPDKAGAVHRLIEPLARHGVSMKRFESRPARQLGWEYNFYIDVMGHQDDAQIAAALAELKEQTAFYKVVGSYPRAR